MLSAFPELLSYGLFAPPVLRLILGVFFVMAAFQHSTQKSVLQSVWPAWTRPVYSLGSILEGLVGVLLIVGLYTQIAALVAVIYFIEMLVFKIARSQFAAWAPHNTFFYATLLTIALSLLVLGAGAFAFDLPL